MKVALLGAESTGKTTLCTALAGALRARGRRVEVVGEVLREWCVREGRVPRPQEHEAIAHEQERRVDEASARADLVLADTTALMVAIHGALLFEDAPLYRFALARQRGYDATLVMGLDLPWVADGLHREGPDARPPVDALVRGALERAAIAYRVVYGTGPARVRSALGALGLAPPTPPRAAWTTACERCSDPDCEHRLFARLLAARPDPDSRA